MGILRNKQLRVRVRVLAGSAALLILAHEHARDAHWRFKGHLCNYELIGYLSKY